MKDPRTDRPIITRQQLEQAAAPLFPDPWPETLAAALGWNVRTVQRLGRSDRFPIDRRRAENMAERLAGEPRAYPQAAAQLAAWLWSHISPGRNGLD